MSSTAGITAPPVRKQRQTRIVEHLKAVKKSASSGAGVSTPRAKLDAVMEAQQQASKVSNVKTVTAAVTSPKKGQNVQGVSAVPAEKEGAEDIAYVVYPPSMLYLMFTLFSPASLLPLDDSRNQEN